MIVKKNNIYNSSRHTKNQVVTLIKDVHGCHGENCGKKDDSTYVRRNGSVLPLHELYFGEGK